MSDRVGARLEESRRVGDSGLVSESVFRLEEFNQKECFYGSSSSSSFLLLVSISCKPKANILASGKDTATLERSLRPIKLLSRCSLNDETQRRGANKKEEKVILFFLFSTLLLARN